MESDAFESDLLLEEETSEREDKRRAMESDAFEVDSLLEEEISVTGKERISAEYHSDGDNFGTSLNHWGHKELRSSMSCTDVSVDSAYTSSNKLSLTNLDSCPAISVTDSGKEYSSNSPKSETFCDEELLDLEEMGKCPKLTHNLDEDLKLFDEYQKQEEKECRHVDLTEEQTEKEYLIQEKITLPNVSYIKDKRSYFQRNYTTFKEHLEPSSILMDEIISSECRDKSFPERIREATRRQRRADILIKYAAQYLDKDSFESLLKKTNHAHLIKKLKKGSAQQAYMPIASEVKDRSHLLCNKQFKDLLMDEIEPRLIIDRLVEHEVLSFDDHEDVLVTDFRPTRVKNLMKYIKRNPERNFIYFFNLLKEYYPHLIHHFDTRNTAAGCESTSDFGIIMGTGGWMLTQSSSIDESEKIEFHVELLPPSSDVEMRVVEESETNMEVEYNMKLLDLQQESMHLGSIVIVHRQLTCHTIQKLQKECSTGEIKKYIKSLFTAKDVEQMRRDGVTDLVLKITAKESLQVQPKLLKPMKITPEAVCENETYLDSVIPGIHGSFTDTSPMVTGQQLQENTSFLLDELEPKEYVQAFDSILPQDVLIRLTANIDRREKAKLFLDEIVKKGQQAVDIFISELERLGRHHVLNILRDSCTNTSGANVYQIAYQIRNSIVNNYHAFVAELEPKTFGTFFVERRVMDNALYEKICQLSSRRNRAVAFFKWLLDEERPDAYIAFQKAVGIFSSDKFVKMLETTESLSTSGISSPAADQTNDVARTHVLLYLARFKITFFNDIASSTQGQKRETMPEPTNDDKSDDRDMMSWGLNISENEIDMQDSVYKYQEIKESGISVDTDLRSNFSVKEQTESLVAGGSDLSRCGSSVFSWSIKPRNIRICPNNTNHIPSKTIPHMLKVPEWPLKQDTADIDVCSTPSEDHHFIQSSTRSDATSSASRQSQEELIRANTDYATLDERNETSSEICMLSNLKMKEEDEKLLTNDYEHKIKLHKQERDSEPGLVCGKTFPKEPNTSFMNPHNQKMTDENEKLVTNDIALICVSKEVFPLVSGYEKKMKLLKCERYSEPRLLNAKTLQSKQNRNISSKEKVTKWLSEQSLKSSTTDFSSTAKLNTGCVDPDKHLLHHQMESTAAELGEETDHYHRLLWSRRDVSAILVRPDKSNSNTEDEIVPSDIGYMSNSDQADIDQMTTSSFTSSGHGTRSLTTRESNIQLWGSGDVSGLSFVRTKSQRNLSHKVTKNPQYLTHQQEQQQISNRRSCSWPSTDFI